MPSRSVNTALRDILHHIDLATNFSAGFDRASFKLDIKTAYAVTRCLEIISEASRRLPHDVQARHPAIGWIANGRRGKCLSPRLRRRFGRLCVETVQRALPPLRVVVEAELKRGA
jgi:uncharacterized protein with HEPN domain